jgi:hypothetical protein
MRSLCCRQQWRTNKVANKIRRLCERSSHRARNTGSLSNPSVELLLSGGAD